MSQSQFLDPRARRTRTALHNSFRELLRNKPYNTITKKDMDDQPKNVSCNV